MFTIVQLFNGEPRREIGNVSAGNLAERLATMREAGDGWGARARVAAAHVPMALAAGAYVTEHGELCVDGEIVEVAS